MLVLIRVVSAVFEHLQLAPFEPLAKSLGIFHEQQLILSPRKLKRACRFSQVRDPRRLGFRILSKPFGDRSDPTGIRSNVVRNLLFVGNIIQIAQGIASVHKSRRSSDLEDLSPES